MLRPGLVCRVVYDIHGSESVSESTFVVVEHEGALHLRDESGESSESAYPYDPATGVEVGNPMATMGIRPRAVPCDGQS